MSIISFEEYENTIKLIPGVHPNSKVINMPYIMAPYQITIGIKVKITI